jgi:hypothetical protein
MFDRSMSGKVVTFTASVSRGVHSGSPISNSSIRTAGSTDRTLGASKAAVWVAKTEGESINAQPEAGSIDRLESSSVVFSELSSENPCEMTGNNSDCPKGAEDWCGIVVAKDGVDGLLVEYGRLPCSRESEMCFAVSTEEKGCGVSSTVGMQ